MCWMCISHIEIVYLYSHANVYMHTHTHMLGSLTYALRVYTNTLQQAGKLAQYNGTLPSHTDYEYTQTKTQTQKICLWREATCALPENYQIFLLWGMSQNMRVSCPPAYLYVCWCGISTHCVNPTAPTHNKMRFAHTYLHKYTIIQTWSQNFHLRSDHRDK